MKSNKTQSPLFFSNTLDFLTNYLPKQLGRSPETQRSYEDSLTVFRRYLLNHKGISIANFTYEQCTKDLLLDYCSFLKEQGNSAATCNSRLSAIKSYVQYSADCNISLQSVALQVSKTPSQKIPKREKKLLSNEALAALLNRPENTRIGLRNRTIMILLYDTAIRVSELTNLRINNVNLDSLSIHVHGKGNKERSVAITDKTAEHLKIYLQAYHKVSDDCESYLFYTVIKGKKDHISTSTVENFIQKYADEVRKEHPDIPERVYPHLLRAERATNLYQDGVDPILISKILGHSSIETTKIYALPSMDQMRAAMSKVPTPTDTIEKPLWEGSEDEMARQCGLR